MRLTQHLRGQIERNLLRDTFDARWVVLAKRESELAFKVRDYAAGSKLDSLLVLPASFVNLDSDVSVKVGESDLYAEVYFHPERSRYRLFDRCGGAKEIAPRRVVLLAPGHNLARSAVALFRDWGALRADVRSIEAKVSAVLNKASTVKKLVELWPEIAKHIPAAAETENLPAVPVAELNADIERARVA